MGNPIKKRRNILENPAGNRIAGRIREESMFIKGGGGGANKCWGTEKGQREKREKEKQKRKEGVNLIFCNPIPRENMGFPL